MMNVHFAARWVVVALSSVAAVGGEASAGSRRDDVLSRLRQREAALLPLECTYSSRLESSKEYANSYADSMKMTLQEALDHFRIDANVTFAARRRGADLDVYMEQRTFGGDGLPQSHWLVSNDGGKRFYVHDIPSAGERRVPQVTLNSDVESRFNSGCHLAILLGLCLPYCKGTLSELAEAGEIDAPASIDGVECTRIRYTTPADGDGAAVRYTVVLDDQKGFCIRSILQEQNLTAPTEWTPTLRWTSEQIRLRENTDLWLPFESKREELGVGEALLLKSNMSIKTISPKSSSLGVSFTPKIEDGSNVWDESQKRGYVSGRKPSKRILGFIKASADEARNENLEINIGPTLRVSQLGDGYAGTLLIIVGAGIVLGALAWQWRTKVS
ncbi:MAG: hypothetical protein BGO49_05625 [Planctomycetales bacterium 71-10]|nr:MAG: hypothetical protein BGO49_05625 [Planctomycetales bacterium 71-10]